MSLIAESKTPVLPPCPRILIVDDEADIREMIEDTFGRSMDCILSSASCIKEAQRIIATQPVGLLIADLALPDGDGFALVRALRQHHPMAEAIVITGNPSVDGAIGAMRQGAVDFVPKPFTAEALLERVRRVLYRQSQIAKNEARIERLRQAVRRLNNARKTVSKKVDLLCNDLISAYGELSRQLDEVRTQENFRSLLNSARDLEQLLCHAMDWLLRQLGYANVAIWLAGNDTFELGAYMKYTVVGDAALTEAMRDGLVRRIARDGLVHAEGGDARKIMTTAEAKLMPGQSILGSHCTYLGESLAAVILFRESTKPFTPEDELALKTISPIFAVALASVVRGGGNDEVDESGGHYSGDDTIAPDDRDEPRPRRKRSDIH
ncbi:MAG TPA: response regulator, partial [Tepidisphaeraceae bacterium]|nr:response regulator [Tepidisphaeraceae bacterium]